MADTNLNIWLRLKDQVSKGMTDVQSRLTSFAQSFKQHWLAITASVMAAVMALRQAWNMAELGAKAEQIENSFKRMAESVNVDAQRMKQALMDASSATVNFSNVADKASALMAQGLNMDEVAALMQQARVEARLFGKTTEESFQVISSAVTGGLVTTLRRAYGLQLSLEKAVTDYATATGKSTDEVKKSYMAQALANHILAEGKSHLQAVNLEQMTAYERMQKLKAQWLAIQESMGQGIVTVAVAMQGIFQILASGVMELVKFGYSLVQHALTPFHLLAQVADELGERFPKLFGGLADALAPVEEAYADIGLQMQAIDEQAANLAGEGAKNIELAFSTVKDGVVESAEVAKEAAEGTKEALASVYDTEVTKQQETIDQMREMWLAWNDEKKMMELARLQAESEFYTLAVDTQKKANQSLWVVVGQWRDQFSAGVSKMFGDMIKGTLDVKKAFIDLGLQMVQALIDFAVQRGINFVLGQALHAAQVGISAATGSAIAAAYAPAAAMVSLATMGGNAVGAQMAIASTAAMAQAVAVPRLAEGGIVDRPTLALIGERGREGVLPLDRAGSFGNTYNHFEINNPVVRSYDDIDTLVEEISYRLARAAERD